MDDREFWLAIRRALMTVANAITKRYDDTEAIKEERRPRPLNSHNT